MKCSTLVATVVVAVWLMASTGYADPITIDMQPYAEYTGPGTDYAYGQDTIYRGLITASNISTINNILVTDSGNCAGADGVFSGFDLDFIVLSRSGDLNDTTNLILPTGGAMIKQGTVYYANGVSSNYNPTALNPGPLFGLTAGGALNNGVATIGTRDASFAYGQSNLAVDTSYGWVSLGVGGQLQANFNNVATTPNSMYVFLGEVGTKQELADAKVTIDAPSNIVTLMPTVSNTTPSNPVIGTTSSGGVVIFNGLAAAGSPVSYDWYIRDANDTSGTPDATGSTLALSYDYFTKDLGFAPGSQHTIALKVTDSDDVSTIYYSTLNVAPEPGTVCLLTIGSAALFLRRRRLRAPKANS